MLLPLGASAYFLYKALATYPRDVATAATARSRGRDREAMVPRHS